MASGQGWDDRAFESSGRNLQTDDMYKDFCRYPASGDTGHASFMEIMVGVPDIPDVGLCPFYWSMDSLQKQESI